MATALAQADLNVLRDGDEVPDGYTELATELANLLDPEQPALRPLR